MKFRTKFLSLAAASALAATAFVMTGCGGGGDGSSGAATGATSSTATATGSSTGRFLKGYWAGIPYVVHKNGTSVNESGKTEEGGVFRYAKCDNVTFKPGLGIEVTFNNMNATGGLRANATQLMSSADELKQGNTTIDKSLAGDIAENLAAIYHQLGIYENDTSVDADRVAQIQAALEEAYNEDTGKFSMNTNDKVDSFDTVVGNLYKKLGEMGISAANGSAITEEIAKGLADTFKDNRTDVEDQMKEVVASVSSSTPLENGPVPADLVNAYVISTFDNGTLADVLSFGSTAESYFVNGTILQSAATGGEILNFIGGSYKEEVEVSNGTDTLTYQATLVPSNLYSNISAGSAFNLTVGDKVFQFHTSSSNRSIGWYNISGKYGYWYMPMPKGESDAASKLIVMANDSSVSAISGITPTLKSQFMTSIVGSPVRSDTVFNDTIQNRTIGFKESIEKNGRPFVAYYWDKLVKIYNDWVADADYAFGSSNATFSGAKVEEATFSGE